MSGPTLQLNITAPGQQKVEATISSIERLVAALGAIPAASAEINRLNKALSGASAGAGGLKRDAGDLKELVGEIKNLGAQLNTSFGSLEETIKKGWGKAARAQEEGAAKAKAASAKGGFQTAYQTPNMKAQGLPPQDVSLAWFAKLQTGSLKIAESQEKALQAADARLRAAFDARYAREAAERVKMQVTSAQWAESYRAAEEKRLAGLEASRVKMQVTSAQWAESYRAAEEKRLAGLEASRVKMQVTSAQWAESARVAAEKVKRSAAELDAAYLAMSKAGQSRVVLRARSRLDQGVAPEAVQASFGSQALAAAQGTSFANAYGQVHTKVNAATTAVKGAVPHIQNLSAAMRDGHSAARGLASGFGQMALTWGAIGPLLAGAALSQSFVQAVKMGLAVRQSLEELRVLSNESASAVASLEDRLESLGRSGPFGPKQIADAMKTLSLAGLEAKEVAQALKPSLDFAVTGGVEIQKSAENLVAIGTAYGYQASQFSLVADAVSKSAAVSMSSVDSMVGSFRSSSIVAQAYGVSLKDTATALALLANIGIRGTAAGTSLRQMYSELSGATASTRNAMRRLNVEVVDGQGKMKPLITIVSELSRALSQYDGKGRIAAIQALANERGSKSIVAALAAIEKQAQNTGTTVSNELQRIAREIDDSAGFNAISAAQLASTPQNLMKGVASSFQTALLKAYESMEPTLVLFATKVRDIFNSKGFQDGLGTMVRGVSFFVSALVDGVKWLEMFAKGFLAYKIVQLFTLGLSGASVALAWLNGSLKFTAAGLVTAEAAALAGTAAFGKMALAARVLTIALRVAGPLAIALTLASFAFSAYAKAQEDSRIVEARATAARENNTLESLLKERDRLVDVTAELAKGKTAREADATATLKQAAAEEALARSRARAPYQEALSTALLKLDTEAKLNGGKGRPMMMPLLQQQASEAAAQLNAFDAASDARAKAIVRAQEDIKRMSLAVEIAQAGDTQPPKLGTEDWYNRPDPAAAARDNAQHSALKKLYDSQEKSADEAYRRQMELLDIKHKGQLVSESSYSKLSEQYADQLYAAKTRSLESYVNDSQSLLQSLLSDPKKAPGARAAIEQIDAEARQAKDQLDFLREKNALQQAARGNLLGNEVRTGLDKLREEVELQREKFEVEQRQVGMASSYVAAEQAKLDVQAKGAASLKKLQEQLYLADMELGKVYAVAANNPDPRGSNLDETAEARLQAEIRRLRSLLKSAQEQVDSEAGKAGDVASARAIAAKNTWATYIAEGKNAERVLQDSRAEFMNSWVDQGRTVWADWLATGKLNLNSFGDLIKKTFAEITYKRFIAEPLSKMGEGAFDKLLKPTAETKSSDQGVAGAFSELRTVADGLGNSLSQLGGDFWQLVRSLGQSLAAMLNQAGATNAGAWVGKLFGADSASAGSTEAIPAGEMVNASGWALGGAFDQGVRAFARGASFTNSVIDSPHVFRFGRGASSLGVAGEAGPEAIMPLARDSSGSLGVKVHGGGSAQAGPKTIVVVENHGNGEAPQITKQQQPNGDELVRIVLNATAKDISKGGKVRKSIQGSVRTTPNLPRY